MPDFDPAQASGEAAMRGSRLLELNEVSLNGDGSAKEIAPGKWERQGGYFRKRILVGNPKDQKPLEVDLGKEINVVFLKIRRKLVERGKDGTIVRSTNEHDNPNNAVTLYENATKTRIHGVAADLRKKYEGLRTVQIVYALLCGEGQPELVRLTIKGASLGSEVKAADVPNFYGYIQSFTGQDHFYQFKTVLTPVLEEGKQSYFAINYRRGDKLMDTSYAFALERMREVAENCREVEVSRAARISSDVVVEPVEEDINLPHPPEDLDKQYPTDINPDDIPF